MINISERKIFRKLISVDRAREIFQQNAPHTILPSEKIELLSGLGRVLAQDLFSPGDVPPFDRASMDGYAVKAEDTTGSEEDNPITLRVVASVKAGFSFEGIVKNHTCVEIATGAPLPNGTDSVVMVEYTNQIENNVEIYQMITPGENVMAAGTDIQLGERMLTSGTILSSRELAVLAAMGFDKVEVIRKLKVAIFSSGDEIIKLGKKLSRGKLYDVNSTAIAASIIENGGSSEFLGIIKDEKEILEKKLSSALNNYDLIIISGGTSAGMGDILYSVIDRIGSPGLLVHGIKVKPGKPTILAVCKGTPIIGLPGYPASALSIYNLFVKPYIRYRTGLPQSKENIIKAMIRQRIRSVSGRHEFKSVNLIKSSDGWLAFPVPGGSGAITSIALADGYVEIPEDISFLLPNEIVEVSLFSDKLRLFDLQIIGSHCIALSHLQKLYSSKYPQYISRAIVVGSTGGVAAIRRGEAHIAGIHLLDENKGYNKWLEDELDCIIIPGYYRMQGFIVQKGNPKNINSIKDLTKQNVRFLNRNPGSGTRILFDMLLNKTNVKKEKISGYNTFGRSHTSIATAVKSGLADVAVGIQSVVTDELEFIELKEEEYDFLVNRNYAMLQSVKHFISLIKSDEFKNMLAKIPGYRLK